MKKHLSRNNLYLLIATLLIILVVGGLLIFLKTSRPITNIQSNNKPEFVFDANKYKTLARDFYARLSSDDFNSAKEIKTQLLAMTVSKEFKEAHLQLVIASASLEDYALSLNKDSLNQAKTILNKLKKDYRWLTDKAL